MKRITTISLALLAAGIMSARGGEAKDIWAKECAKCHGPDGKGKTTMGRKLEIKDYTDPKNQAELKDDKMAKAIKEGVKDGDKIRMKAFGEMLKDAEVKALVAYFRGLKK
jgi:mono/diheme cytochrome c family protein